MLSGGNQKIEDVRGGFQANVCSIQNFPGPAHRHLVLGNRGGVSETPKPGDPAFERVQNLIIGDNQVPLKAAAETARSAGFRTQILTSFLKGEAREVGRVFGSIAREFRQGSQRPRGKTCLLSSGETTVTVQGKGKGGRCQEFVLAAAIEIAGLPRTVVAAFGTDGTDGPTEAAGAYADGNTVHQATLQGLEPTKSLHDNDSFPFFKALKRLIITGPTLTNLNDLYLLITY